MCASRSKRGKHFGTAFFTDEFLAKRFLTLNSHQTLVLETAWVFNILKK